jgi:hypothetical protein
MRAYLSGEIIFHWVCGNASSWCDPSYLPHPLLPCEVNFGLFPWCY